nr:hypothetical protein [Tanacetum cinerariifolium]
KALYGLKQAPRAWYDILSQFLIDSGFQKGSIDTTLFIKKKGKHIMLIQIYVDDIIFGSTNPKYCTKFSDLMVKRFEMRMMGEMKFLLGLQVNQFSNGIFINQSKYILDILKIFGMANYDTVPTPMVEQAKLKLNLVRKPVDHNDYRSMIGSLMYVTSNRPDIMFATCLWYPKDSGFDLTAYSNADHAGCHLDRKTLVAEKTKVTKRKEKVVVSSDSEGSSADDFSELKKITALLAKTFNRRKFYSKPTNNNLRTSSTSQSANKKQEFVKSDDKKVKKKDDEKKRDMSKVKYKKDSDEQVLLAEDQAWMKSSSDSDQEINANMVFMAQIEKVLSDSDESSSSAEETIAEVAYYTSESESEYEFETSEYYDNSTNYGLFVNNDDDQEIFHDEIESASESFNENHIGSQKDYDKSEVDHNDSEEKEHLVDKLIRKFNHKIAKCQKRIEKANQQSKDLENQNKDLQERYDALINQIQVAQKKVKIAFENADSSSRVELISSKIKGMNLQEHT